MYLKNKIISILYFYSKTHLYPLSCSRKLHELKKLHLVIDLYYGKPSNI